MPSIDQAIEIALAHHRAGRFALAEEIYRRILAAAPDHAPAMHLLGVVAHQQGRHAEAVEHIRRAVELEPRQPHFHNNLGEAWRAQGRFEDAAACYERAIAVVPDYPEAWNNLGLARYGQRRFEEAAECYRRALAVRADQVEVHNNLGMVLQELGRRDEAAACYRQALHIAPHFAVAHNNLGSLCKEEGRLDEALACFGQAVRLQPDYVDAHYNLGLTCEDLGRLNEAAACYERAIELRPAFAEAHTNLGNVCQLQGRVDESLAHYRRALELKPDHVPSLSNLGNVLGELGAWDESMACFRRALELHPTAAETRSNLLVALQYAPHSTAESLAAAHAEYQQAVAAPLYATWANARTEQPHRPRSDRPLRLGFVSADFARHPVGYLTIRVLEALRELGCQTVCYSDRIVTDDLTARFRAAASQWHEVFSLAHEQLARKIRDDQIDVLFDLAGHTAHNRLPVFARKPAPLQITWAGYVGTTGLAAMDFLLADRFHVPPEAEPFYVERVLRMPDGYVCFDTPGEAPPVGELPSRATGRVTLASFNNPAKIHAQVVATWAAILDRLPGSRLVLKYRALDSRAASSRLRQLFAAHGIAAERIELQGFSPRAELLGQYNRVDLALDTFPYSGGLTTCEALWMGVPVVTCPGATFASRHALSHLSNVGLTETIAENLDEYVERAVRLAQDRVGLAELRAGLRQRVARSPLCDGRRFAENLVRVLEPAVANSAAPANRGA
jgi:predicted O-linked N-acetylglucosamine transferase (SPINDLY family)